MTEKISGMTIEEALEDLKETLHECVCSTIHYYTDRDMPMLQMAISALEEIQQYRAIGTVERFRELEEKATAKKVIYQKQSYGTPWLCPNCEADQVKVEFMSTDGSEPKKKHSFCWKCGQKLLWD